MKVWENSKKLWRHLLVARVPQHFSFPQTSTCVSITWQKHGTCFVFLKDECWWSSWSPEVVWQWMHWSTLFVYSHKIVLSIPLTKQFNWSVFCIMAWFYFTSTAPTPMTYAKIIPHLQQKIKSKFMYSITVRFQDYFVIMIVFLTITLWAWLVTNILLIVCMQCTFSIVDPKEAVGAAGGNGVRKATLLSHPSPFSFYNHHLT